jgi:hypothetical protein
MINWAYFPQSEKVNDVARTVVQAFEKHTDDINSSIHGTQVSDEVLAKLASTLEAVGFEVERGKKKVDKIHVPVLFGRNGMVEKAFEADAFHRDGKFVLEVEAGRGVTNYQFLKDLFQACMMQDVDYLGVAIRNKYRNSNDFEKVYTFFDTLYKSNRIQLPLKGVLIVGY